MTVGDEGFCNYLYQGQTLDKETGLAYNRFRYYDPDDGNYISQDPIGLAGGGRLYGYVGNTTNWLDPYGLIKENYVYALKNDVGKIVYVGIGNPDERFKAHQNDPNKKGQFDKMEVIANCNDRRSARDIEGSLLNKMGDPQSEFYNKDLLNKTRIDKKYYHSYADIPEAPRKLLSDDELKDILNREPLSTKTCSK